MAEVEEAVGAAEAGEEEVAGAAEAGEEEAAEAEAEAEESVGARAPGLPRAEGWR